jgi:hypothetical protein
MSGTIISRLHLRAPSGHLAAAQLRVEDAMRLADTDGRLLLLRRLDLGPVRPGASPTLWAALASQRVRAQRDQAVHAMTPGAGSAAAVWFRSAEEAWMLLLLELAAGRPPTAWFWRLAVRGWNGAPLQSWLPLLIAAEFRNPPSDAALARAIVRAVAAGGLDAVAAALAMAPPSSAGLPSAIARRETASCARRLLARLDPVVRTAITRWIAAGAAKDPARLWIVRSALVSVAPELIAHEAALTALCGEVVAIALASSQSKANPPDAEEAIAAAAEGHRQVAGDVEEIDRAGDGRPGDLTTPADARAITSPAGAPRPRANAPSHASEPVGVAAKPDEQPSAAAGLFLLIRPLVLMGLPEWLKQRPGLATDGFARALLRAIAVKLHVRADDPVFAALDMPIRDSTIAPAILSRHRADADASHRYKDAITGEDDDVATSPDLAAWRVGLDGWLRRRAHIKLAEVVCRRGWVTTTDDAVSVRFRIGTADIRLRRLALDIDPGWVPFLGWVIRYHYRDDPFA